MRQVDRPEPERFPSTHWSLVDRAGGDDGEARRGGLESLLKAYLPALKAHLVRNKRLQDAAADDLVQSFITDKIIDGQFLSQADASRGRFRTFLLTSLDRYLISDIRKQSAGKRQPSGGRVLAIDEATSVAASREDSPDAFDLAWARCVLGRAVERMEQECRAGGRPDLWLLFQHRVLEPILNRVAPPEYDGLAQRFGFASPVQACNALKTSRRIFERALRSVIAEYAGTGPEVESEMLDLKQIIGRMRT